MARVSSVETAALEAVRHGHVSILVSKYLLSILQLMQSVPPLAFVARPELRNLVAAAHFPTHLSVALIGRGGADSRTIGGVEEGPQLVVIVVTESEVVLVFLKTPVPVNIFSIRSHHHHAVLEGPP